MFDAFGNGCSLPHHGNSGGNRSISPTTTWSRNISTCSSYRVTPSTFPKLISCCIDLAYIASSLKKKKKKKKGRFLPLSTDLPYHRECVTFFYATSAIHWSIRHRCIIVSVRDVQIYLVSTYLDKFEEIASCAKSTSKTRTIEAVIVRYASARTIPQNIVSPWRFVSRSQKSSNEQATFLSSPGFSAAPTNWNPPRDMAPRPRIHDSAPRPKKGERNCAPSVERRMERKDGISVDRDPREYRGFVGDIASKTFPKGPIRSSRHLCWWRLCSNRRATAKKESLEEVCEIVLDGELFFYRKEEKEREMFGNIFESTILRILLEVVARFQRDFSALRTIALLTLTRRPFDARDPGTTLARVCALTSIRVE